MTYFWLLNRHLLLSKVPQIISHIILCKLHDHVGFVIHWVVSWLPFLVRGVIQHLDEHIPHTDTLHRIMPQTILLSPCFVNWCHELLEDFDLTLELQQGH